MKKITSSCLLALVCVPSLFSLTLKDTVNEVIQTNPVVQERLRNYRATSADMSAATSGYKPVIDLIGGIGWKTQGHLNDDIREEDFNTYNSAIVLRQNLFNGFDTLYAVEYEKARVVSAAYDYVEKTDDMALKATKAYINLLRANELYTSMKENVQNNEMIYSEVYELYVSGVAARSELDKIQSSLALSRSNLTAKRNNLVDARFDLHRVLGRNVSIEALVRPEFNSKLPVNRVRAVQFALAHNPSLMVSRFNIKSAQKKYKQTRSNYYPSLDLEASQNYSDNWKNSTSPDDRFEVMLVARYNLYNGGHDSAIKQKNISLINKEVEKQRELKRELIHSIGISWSAYEITESQLDDLYKFQSFSLSTLELYQEEYALGQRSLLDLLAAQNDFFNAQRQIINIEYDRLFAKYRILDAMGVLVVALLGNDVDYYQAVGLQGNTAKVEDSLPVNFDQDGDKIPDDQDMCTNSELNSSVMPYGCVKFVEDKDDDGVTDNYDLCPNTPLGFAVNEDGCPKSKNLDIKFEESSAKISPKSKLYVEQFARFLQENPLYNVMIIGHTDDTKTDAQSLKLSKDRANSVKEVLLKLGIDDSRLNAIGVGRSQSIADNSTPEGRLKNRRIEIKLNYVADRVRSK